MKTEAERDFSLLQFDDAVKRKTRAEQQERNVFQCPPLPDLNSQSDPVSAAHCIQLKKKKKSQH